MRDLQAALSDGRMLDKERTGEILNIGNISKDDAESIINMLRDYVTIKLGNGNEVKMPKLNLDVLPGNFPEEVKNQLSAQLAQIQSVSDLQVVSEISSPISPDSGAKNPLQVSKQVVQPVLLQASTEKPNISSFNNTTTEDPANLPVNEFRSSDAVVHEFN